jgi:hypothetical protein
LQKPAKPPPKRFRLAPPKLRLTEKDVTKQVCDYLRVRGWSVHRCHVGVYQPISGGAPVRMGEKGMTDLFAVRPKHGAVAEFFWLELKAPGNRPSPDQSLWMERQHAAGFEAVCFDSLEKCADWVETRFT